VTLSLLPPDTQSCSAVSDHGVGIHCVLLQSHIIQGFDFLPMANESRSCL